VVAAEDGGERNEWAGSAEGVLRVEEPMSSRRVELVFEGAPRGRWLLDREDPGTFTAGKSTVRIDAGGNVLEAHLRTGDTVLEVSNLNVIRMRLGF
jgi:hypothetical protein